MRPRSTHRCRCRQPRPSPRRGARRGPRALVRCSGERHGLAACRVAVDGAPQRDHATLRVHVDRSRTHLIVGEVLRLHLRRDPQVRVLDCRRVRIGRGRRRVASARRRSLGFDTKHVLDPADAIGSARDADGLGAALGGVHGAAKRHDAVRGRRHVDIPRLDCGIDQIVRLNRRRDPPGGHPRLRGLVRR
jgi:hypothetical protein